MTDQRTPKADAESPRDTASGDDSLRRRLDATEHFPDQNPDPVLRIDPAGALVYSNPASLVLVRDLGLADGEPLRGHLLGPLNEALGGPEGSLAEVEVGWRTFCFKPVASPEFDFVNVYGHARWRARRGDRLLSRGPDHSQRDSAR